MSDSIVYRVVPRIFHKNLSFVIHHSPSALEYLATLCHSLFPSGLVSSVFLNIYLSRLLHLSRKVAVAKLLVRSAMSLTKNWYFSPPASPGMQGSSFSPRRLLSSLAVVRPVDKRHLLAHQPRRWARERVMGATHAARTSIYFSLKCEARWQEAISSVTESWSDPLLHERLQGDRGLSSHLDCRVPLLHQLCVDAASDGGLCADNLSFCFRRLHSGPWLGGVDHADNRNVRSSHRFQRAGSRRIAGNDDGLSSLVRETDNLPGISDHRLLVFPFVEGTLAVSRNRQASPPASGA